MNERPGCCQLESTAGKRIVAPEVRLQARRVVVPGFLRVAHHQPGGVGEAVVHADVILAPVDGRGHGVHPVVAASGPGMVFGSG